MSDNSPTNVENVLKGEITIHYNNDAYIFKVPSVRDRLHIAAKAAQLRKETDPEGNGIALGYDPTALMLSDRIATLLVLLRSSEAKWVYSPGPTGPVMDVDKWPDNAPIMEVIDQFNNELEMFRKAGNKSGE
jgi:hypothetical protein